MTRTSPRVGRAASGRRQLKLRKILAFSLLAGLALGALTTMAEAASSVPAGVTQEDDQPQAPELLRGTLTDEGEPVPGVVISVADDTGQELEAVETDAEGDWLLELPGPGSYVVTLDEGTLPEGVTLRDPGDAEQEWEIRPTRRQRVSFTLGDPVETPADEAVDPDADVEVAAEDAEPPPGVNRFLQSLLNGVRFGLIIAMTAIGLSLIFGTTGLINFAHGDLVTLGAILAWYFNTTGPQLNLVLAALIVIPLVGLVGGVLERGLWRPLRDRKVGLFQMLIISVGLGLVIRHILLIFFGGRSRSYTDFNIQERIRLGPIAITPRDLIIIGLSIVVLVAVATMLQRTRLGKAMRAVSDNPELAEASGIDVKKVVLVVWIMGAALAALGGILLGAIQTVNWLMGFQLLLLMFAGVILGGLGTAYGALVGSLVVGIVIEVSTVWVTAEIKFVWGLVVLIGVLLLRPQGILGIKERVG